MIHFVYEREKNKVMLYGRMPEEKRKEIILRFEIVILNLLNDKDLEKVCIVFVKLAHKSKQIDRIFPVCEDEELKRKISSIVSGLGYYDDLVAPPF